MPSGRCRVSRRKEKPGNPKVYISPYPPDDTSEPIMMKLGRLAGFAEVIKCAKFGVNRLNGVSSVKW